MRCICQLADPPCQFRVMVRVPRRLKTSTLQRVSFLSVRDFCQFREMVRVPRRLKTSTLQRVSFLSMRDFWGSLWVCTVATAVASHQSVSGLIPDSTPYVLSCWFSTLPQEVLPWLLTTLTRYLRSLLSSIKLTAPPLSPKRTVDSMGLLNSIGGRTFFVRLNLTSKL